MSPERAVETRNFRPLLSKDEYLNLLPESDRINFSESLRLIHSVGHTRLLREILKNLKLYAVGSAAVPRELLGRDPNDIDLRITVPQEVEFHQTYQIMRAIDNRATGYGFNLWFKSHYIEDFDENSIVVELTPESGRKIDIFLPTEQSRSVYYELEKYETTLDTVQLADDLESAQHYDESYKNKEIERAYKRVYVVRLV